MDNLNNINETPQNNVENSFLNDNNIVLSDEHSITARQLAEILWSNDNSFKDWVLFLIYGGTKNIQPLESNFYQGIFQQECIKEIISDNLVEE